MFTARQFTKQIRSSIPCGFSQRVENVYNQTISRMRSEPHMHGFHMAGGNPSLEDSSPFGIARQYYHYFQVHFEKAYYSLLDISDEMVNQGKYSWLDKPRLYVIDIGAGTGGCNYCST